MESITIKIHDEMAKEIEKSIKPDYGTKTEFIREAIRDKLMKQREQQLKEHFMKYFGKSKRKTTNKELRRIKEKVGRQFAQERGMKLD